MTNDDIVYVLQSLISTLETPSAMECGLGQVYGGGMGVGMWKRRYADGNNVHPNAMSLFSLHLHGFKLT